MGETSNGLPKGAGVKEVVRIQFTYQAEVKGKHAVGGWVTKRGFRHCLVTHLVHIFHHQQWSMANCSEENAKHLARGLIGSLYSRELFFLKAKSGPGLT